MRKILFVVTLKDVKTKVLERLWYKGEYLDYYLMINEYRDSFHIHWPILRMVSSFFKILIQIKKLISKQIGYLLVYSMDIFCNCSNYLFS